MDATFPSPREFTSGISSLPDDVPNHPIRYLARYRSWLSIGIFALIVTSGFSQTIPWLVKRTIDSMGNSPGKSTTYYLTLLTALVIAQALIRIVSRTYIFNVGRHAEFEIRSQIYAHLMRLDAGFFHRFRTGDIMSRLTNDLAAVRGLFGPGILHAINTLFAYIVALPLMMRINFELTLLALIPYPMLILGTRTFARRVYQHSTSVQRTLAELTASAQEDLAGIRELRSYGLEESRSNLFQRASEQYRKEAIFLSAWRGIVPPVVGLGTASSFVLVLTVGGSWVSSGKITLGDLVALMMYVGLLAWPTTALGWMITIWQRGVSAWGRLSEILRSDPQIAFSMPVTPRISPNTVSSECSFDLEVRNLTLTIGEKNVLSDIAFTLKNGKVLGLVGRVGSGKTQLLEAIARLIAVPEDTIFIDGECITRLAPEDVRKRIAYSPQDAFLFSDSLRQNVAFGIPSDFPANMLDEHILEAVDQAGLAYDIEALPQRLDTIVGERGVALSGGQRQRVALARALASNRPLLLLDDSLSAVDAKTEETILASLRDLLRGSTAIIVSHRLSALRQTDHILVLEAGQIIQRGTHTELISSDGAYFDMYRSQLLSDSTPSKRRR